MAEVKDNAPQWLKDMRRQKAVTVYSKPVSSVPVVNGRRVDDKD
jgi:hypothetical protein